MRYKNVSYLDDAILDLQIKNPLCIGVYKGETTSYLFLGENAKQYENVTLIDPYIPGNDISVSNTPNPRDISRRYPHLDTVNRDVLIQTVRNQIITDNVNFIIDKAENVDYTKLKYDIVIQSYVDLHNIDLYKELVIDIIKNTKYICFEAFSSSRNCKGLFNIVNELIEEQCLIKLKTVYSKSVPCLLCKV